MKKSLTVFVAVICLFITGCVADHTIPQSSDNAQIARLLSDSFMDYWGEIPEGAMILPLAEILVSDCFADFDKTVFLVYPEYKTCHAVIYGVNGDKVTQIGDISCGFGFAFSNANGGMLRTTKILAGPHTSEKNNTYYHISSTGIEEKLNMSEILDGSMITGYCVYQNGESHELDRKNYDVQKETADSDFNNFNKAVFVSLDVDTDYHMDSGYELSDWEGLSEYILGKLNG